MSKIEERVSDALERLGRLARSDEHQGARAEGLSVLQSRALAVLAGRGRLRIGELARELLVTDGTLSAAVSTLESKDLVRKTLDSGEHRAIVVSLTRKGRSAAERAKRRGGEFLEPALEDLGPTESSELLASLLRLLLAFERRGAIAPTRMCLTCRHFEPDGGRGAKPHFCRLLEAPIGKADWRVDCLEHESASESRCRETFDRFTTS